MVKKYIFLFFLVILIMFARLKRSGHLIYGDGNGYYAYSHALYFEKSLNFKPIISYYRSFKYNNKDINRVSWQTQKLPNGNYANPWTIGTALFWLPAIFIIDMIIKAFQLPFDKFSVIYEAGPFLTGAILNLAGIYFLEKYLNNFFKARVVNLTIIAIIFASNILFYAFFEPALSHQPSFFLLSLLLYWSLNFKKNVINCLILGLISGLLIITRFTNAILLIPIYLSLISKHKLSVHLIIVFIGILLGISPQIVSQPIIYGEIFKNPYLSGDNGFWSLNILNLFLSLFGAKHGLFLWHPIFLLGIAGLIITRSKKSLIFLLTYILLWIAVSGWSGVGSAGFGERMFYESIIFLSFGIAAFFNRIGITRAILACGSLCFWNFICFAVFFISET